MEPSGTVLGGWASVSAYLLTHGPLRLSSGPKSRLNLKKMEEVKRGLAGWVRSSAALRRSAATDSG